jgi:ankyrin repeat protein
MAYKLINLVILILALCLYPKALAQSCILIDNPDQHLSNALTKCDLEEAKTALICGADGRLLNGQHQEVYALLIKAFAFNDRPLLTLMLDAERKTEKISGQTLLTAAASNANLNLLKLLIECGANIHEQDAQAHNALQYAAWSGYNEMLILLIGLGADVNISTKEGYTPLMAAIELEGTSTAKLLIEHDAQVNAKTESGISVLMRAVTIRDNSSGVKLLLENGAEINHKSKTSKTALSGAINAGFFESAKILIDHGGIVLTKKVNNIGEFIVWATQREDLSLLKFLLTFEVDSLQTSDNRALHYARLRNNQEMIKLLEQLEQKIALKRNVEELKKSTAPSKVACLVEQANKQWNRDNTI